MPNPYTIEDLAQEISGAVVLGEGNHPITALRHPMHVQDPTEMAYIASADAWGCFDNGAMAGMVEATLEIPEHILQKLKDKTASLIQVPRSRVALAVLLDVFEEAAYLDADIHPTAVIHSTAQLGRDVHVGPHASVGPQTVIGDGTKIHHSVSVGAQIRIGINCVLHAGSRIGDRCILGDRVILQPNAVIGSDGFSYVTPKEARHERKSSTAQQNDVVEYENVLRINSVGNVVLEDDVEVGACACIDRGTLSETRIGRGTKIDNLTQIGHNNTVGQNCLIVSQVGIAGSCIIGNNVVMAGQVGLAGHITIGDNSVIMAQSGVMRDMDAGSIVLGTPAMPHKKAMANIAYSMKLKEIVKDTKTLKKQMAEFEVKSRQLDTLLDILPDELRSQLTL